MRANKSKVIIKSIIINLLGLFLLPGICSGVSHQPYGVPHTNITPAQSMIIDQLLRQKKYNDSIVYIDEQLKNDPNNVKLLYMKSGIYTDIEQYDKAKATLHQIAILQPDNAKAARLSSKIEEILQSTPHNELGLNIDEAYVSGIRSYWNYSSLHYYRFTSLGTYGARVNYAKRYGSTAEQYQLEAYPTFHNTVYLQYIQITAAYANFTQFLLPNYQYTIEPYFNLPNNFEFSMGLYGLRSRGVNIYDYTGSLGKYQGNNYFWFRPYHFTPKSSDFFEVGARHYFDNKNTYISIKAGIGKAPDIYDLAPLDQIVVLDQNLVAINGQFSVTTNVYIQAGAGYLRQVFPSGYVRNITDGNFGVIWQF